MRVNRRVNVAEKISHLDAVFYKAEPAKGDNAPQSFWCWPGQELIGAGGRCRKGIFFLVQACSPERLTLESNGDTLSLTYAS